MGNLRVLVVDDQAQLRRSVTHLLQEELGSVTVGEAADSPAALKQVEQTPWDVVVLDVSMRGQDGLDCLTALRAAAPALAVVMFSMEASARVVAESLRRGALGYVLKEHGPDDLVPAQRCALDGQRFTSPALA